jgi:hypothetical protein
MGFKWTLEKLQEEALKYKTKTEFQRCSKSATNAAYKLKVMDLICSHMPKDADRSGEEHPNFKWPLEKLHQEALKYGSRMEFQKNSDNAYQAAFKRKVLDSICSHMSESATSPWTNEELLVEALLYETRNEFFKNSLGAYKASIRRGILDQICSHMKGAGGPSIPERSLFDAIKSIYPKAQTLRVRAKRGKIFIENKPHIQGFDIDIYVPELRKGIEHNGKYWHSLEGLKRSRDSWPTEDLINYNQIKSDYFIQKHGIEILHIDGEDWKSNKQACLNKCLEFLNGKV